MNKIPKLRPQPAMNVTTISFLFLLLCFWDNQCKYTRENNFIITWTLYGHRFDSTRIRDSKHWLYLDLFARCLDLTVNLGRSGWNLPFDVRISKGIQNNFFNYSQVYVFLFKTQPLSRLKKKVYLFVDAKYWGKRL